MSKKLYGKGIPGGGAPNQALRRGANEYETYWSDPITADDISAAISGISEIQGPKGPQGVPGPQGDPGPQGIAGPQGPKGETGIASITPKGTYDSTITYSVNDLVTASDGNAYICIQNGIGQDPISSPAYWVIFVMQGAPGAQGIQGNQGIPGPVGPQGLQGIDGPQGLQGATGPIGPKGDPGSNGTSGINGAKGEQGVPGPKGDIGPIGPTGEQGATGSSGPIGPIGPKGDTGIDGLTGPQGDPGPAGPQGNDGNQGPKGDPGENAVASINPKGDYDPDESYSKFDVIIDSNNNSYICIVDTPPGQEPSTHPEFWSLFVMHGPKGEPGASGERGEQGIQGQEGIQGIPGLQGEKGEQGLQGLQGLPGPQGIQGIPGVQGPKGEPGSQGIQGVAGTAGINGQNGKDGATGPQGLPGPQGLKGDTGAAGVAGKDISGTTYICDGTEFKTSEKMKDPDGTVRDIYCRVWSSFLTPGYNVTKTIMAISGLRWIWDIWWIGGDNSGAQFKNDLARFRCWFNNGSFLSYTVDTSMANMNVLVGIKYTKL